MELMDVYGQLNHGPSIADSSPLGNTKLQTMNGDLRLNDREFRGSGFNNPLLVA